MFEYHVNYIISIFNNYIKKIKVQDNYLKIKVNNLEKLNFIISFFKFHTYFRYNVLTDLACVDFINKNKRFELNYILLSIDYNSRIIISVELDEKSIVSSLINVYSGSNWMEREVWDLYGIYFSNHNDLRRILTDYGFEGYPFRKDFPLNGYLEIRYDEDKQYLLYEPIELMQNMRYYNFNNPFYKKYIL